MTRILLTGAAAFPLTALLGYLLLPVLRALKAGQSIREVGPTWHNYKAGTPMMGGLMFVFATIVCLLVNIPSMEDYTVFYVLMLALCFGFIGFLDDFTKIRHHHRRNAGESVQGVPGSKGTGDGAEAGGKARRCDFVQGQSRNAFGAGAGSAAERRKITEERP